MLKIETSSPAPGERRVVLSGFLRQEHLPELQRLLHEADAEGHVISLDLEDVRLVDRCAVHFLATVDRRGSRLLHCPPYLQIWIESLPVDVV